MLRSGMQAVSKELKDFVEESRPRLLALSEGRAAEKPFPEKWSLKEILGHLVDSAVNNHQRIVRMQERHDIGAFTYGQQHWVASQQYQQRPWEELVELWYQFNGHLAHVIARIDPETLAHTCDMGYAAPATLKFVVEDYVRHARHHVDQILSDSDPRQRSKWIRRDPEG
jgi:DinB superfamily